jgi:hypothetical protein
MGGVHCIGMCGGISSALGLSEGSGQYRKILAYNLGRISSYTLLGCFAGLATGWLQGQWLPIATFMRISANVLLILMGLYLSNWWLGLSRLELLGHRLWKHIQPLGKRLLPIKRSWQALLLGMLWGWLPCGLIYSALVWTATAADAYQSGLLMLAFGVGTLPAMLATGLFAQQLRQQLQRKAYRVIAGLLIIALGSYGLLVLLPEHQHDDSMPSMHHQH